MTNPPPNPPPASAPASPPAKGRVTSLPRDLSDFLVELSITLNKHTIYPAGHPLLGVAIEGVANRLELLFIGERDSLSIGVARKQLIMEGVATDPQNPVLKELAERLHKHHVGALKFQRGITRQELGDSLSALAIDATRSDKPLGLDREALVDRWQHVHFFPLSYDRLQLIEDDGARDCHKASKLIHVCDVYDALRTRRPYRDAWEPARIITYIEERAGTEFEPEAATAFVAMMKRVEAGIQVSPMPAAGDAS